ncbi:MAG: 2-C-methyl-D-erythritol 4-phosphate cytidylyltransferase [Chitinophagaceae bacterium]|nr:2-C-methyl-D-erythritol 4-phosphate cytidylyltransferase [Chitinophagaceae bacterium]
MKKYAVIVAGGSGTRMGSSVPKQFLNLHGKPVLWYTLTTFLNAYADLEIVLVVAEDYLKIGEGIVRSTGYSERVILTTGGPSRFHSVKNGLIHVHGQSIVFVHDGVRCLLSGELIHRCYEMTIEMGNAIPAIQAVDSIRIETDQGNEPVNRDKVKIIQTPQTFYSDIIKAGYEQEFDQAFTDEASVVERLGIKIHLVEGEATNIKITNPLDMVIAEKILEGTFIPIL